jgi:hypothetical protein
MKPLHYKTAICEIPIGISRAPGIGVLCHRKCRNPDGRLYGGGPMVNGHMGYCIAQRANALGAYRGSESREF